MSLRIRLIEPRPAGPNVYDYARLPRLGLPLIGALLAEAGHEVRVYTELLAPIDLEECFGADLVGISSTTATQPAAYGLADLLRLAGVPVVLGGPHVTFCADEALEHAPFVVRGEGEATMVELVDRLERGDDLDTLPGLSFRSDDGSNRHNAGRAAVTQEEYERLPIPALELMEGHERMATKPVMTQRGCPFDCEFCSVTAMFSRRVRYRRPDQVVGELTGLAADRVFFYDDNFVVNRSRTKELLRGMLEKDLTPTWMAQVRADAALRSPARPDIDDELLSLMRDSGCSMVMIGIEAASDEGLAPGHETPDCLDHRTGHRCLPPAWHLGARHVRRRSRHRHTRQRPRDSGLRPETGHRDLPADGRDAPARHEALAARLRGQPDPQP